MGSEVPSPTVLRVLAAVLAATGGTGAALGYAATGDPYVLLTVPVGIVCVGIAVGIGVGVGAGLALGLAEGIRHLVRRLMGVPKAIEEQTEITRAFAERPRLDSNQRPSA